MAGETTATTALDPPFAAPTGLFLVPYTVPFATTELELNDVVEAGYIPANCTVYGVIYSPTDMDSGTALVQKITVGSTDVATGLTGGQTGAKTFVGCVPLTVTAKTKVSITSTTAAGTAVAGTVYLGFLCQK